MQKQNEAKKQGAKSRAQKKHQKAEREKKIQLAKANIPEYIHTYDVVWRDKPRKRRREKTERVGFTFRGEIDRLRERRRARGENGVRFPSL